MANIGYQIKDDGDLLVKDGDFVKADMSQVHIERMLLSAEGEWRQFPSIGVHLKKYLKSPVSNRNKVSIKKKIRLNLLSDGFRIISVKVPDYKNIEINAEK